MVGLIDILKGNHWREKVEKLEVFDKVKKWEMSRLPVEGCHRDSENTEIEAFYRADEGIPRNDCFRWSTTYHRQLFAVASVSQWLIHGTKYFKKVLAPARDFSYTLPK